MMKKEISEGFLLVHSTEYWVQSIYSSMTASVGSCRLVFSRPVPKQSHRGPEFRGIPQDGHSGVSRVTPFLVHPWYLPTVSPLGAEQTRRLVMCSLDQVTPMWSPAIELALNSPLPRYGYKMQLTNVERVADNHVARLVPALTSHLGARAVGSADRVANVAGAALHGASTRTNNRMSVSQNNLRPSCLPVDMGELTPCTASAFHPC